jgi:GntR family carbon starvation induced transcriptional regulator
LTTNIASISTFADPSVNSPIDPVQNPSKAAAYWLLRDIVRGVFQPMERLKVEHLVNFYGVGHSPVREAILMLSSTGLVVHEHQKGYRVAPVSLADYDDVLAVYQRLYKLALTMAIDLGDDAWEERVVVRLHRTVKVQRVLPDGDPQLRERWQRAYWEYHAELLSGCGSPLMMQLLGDIGFRLERYVNLFADLEIDRESDNHAEHREIVEAVIARDKERALLLIERYFATAQPMRNSIIETLKRNEAQVSRRRRSSVDAAQAFTGRGSPVAEAAE